MLCKLPFRKYQMQSFSIRTDTSNPCRTYGMTGNHLQQLMWPPTCFSSPSKEICLTTALLKFHKTQVLLFRVCLIITRHHQLWFKVLLALGPLILSLRLASLSMASQAGLTLLMSQPIRLSSWLHQCLTPQCQELKKPTETSQSMCNSCWTQLTTCMSKS